MKISAPSGDLLIKLTLGAAVLGGVAWALYRAKNAVSDAASSVADAVSDTANAINPLNNDNVIYQTANVPVQVITGNPYATLGTWIYDLLHPNQYDPNAPSTRAPSTSAATPGINGSNGHTAYWRS